MSNLLLLNKGEYTGEIINQVTIEGNIITNTHYSTKKNTPEWHYHENAHLCFVFQNGKAETRTATNYVQKTGSIFFYHSEEKHRWISPALVSKSANIEIEKCFLKNYELSETTVKEAIFNNINAKSILLKIQQEMLLSDTNSHTTIQMLLLELVTYSKKHQTKNRPIWIPRLIELLNDHWNEQLSLKEIASIIGVHPVTISKYFRKYFYCTFGEYYRTLKINKSIELIKNSTMSLSEIAFYCQFADQSHFIRNFKQMTGFLPNDFRRF